MAKWLWIGICSVAVIFFGIGAGYFIVQAFRFLFYPPWWEVALSHSSDPEIRALTRGDVTMLFMLACGPMAFLLIWMGRLVDAVHRDDRRLRGKG